MESGLSTPTFRVEVHNPALASGPGLGSVRFVWSRRLPPAPKEAPRYRDEGFDEFPVADLPMVVERLLRHGHSDAARTVCDAWFVSVGQAAGLVNIVLSGGQ